MPSKSALTIALFGVTALFAGLSSLLLPSASLEILQLPLAALPSLYGNSVASTAMGIYYLLAAYQENKAFFIATVPVRFMTTSVFWTRCYWRTAAIWEGIGAALTAVALLWEAMHEKAQVEKKRI